MLNKRFQPKLVFPAVLLGFALTVSLGTAQTAAEMGDLLRPFSWRAIGPAVPGGRTTDIEAVEAKPWIIFAAIGPSGVWKSENAGTSWSPVFFNESTVSVGDLAVNQANPDIVWVGTGEATCRNSVTVGDGVYQSTDGGKTWTNRGLKETRHISRILIDRNNPDIVFVAAMGALWNANIERGVFKTVDGGKTWKKTLYIDENTGIADLAADWADSRILYAAAYEHRRLPWIYTSGGKGSGLYRSNDGGETWTKLTKGLPGGMLGRIGLGTSRSNPAVVYAVVEAKDGGIFRSEDRGETWARTCPQDVSDRVANRPFYYSQIRVDPTDDKKFYVLATGLSMSKDGGQHFQGIGGGTHSDHHSLWIDPGDPLHLIEGNDGGIDISWDGARTWNPVQSIDAAEVYQVGVDFQKPYFVYCGLQDNNAWGGPSASRDAGGVRNEDWFILSGGDGFFAQPDPNDPNTVYSNSQANGIVRFDRRINQAKGIRPEASLLDPPYRYNWNSPIHLSPHDSRVVYCGAQFLLRSPDRGQSWEMISPDLTTNNPDKLKDSGGPITPDNSSAESHCTITTIAESPVKAGVIWVGTDDGNVQVTLDNGKKWTNTIKAFPGLPPCTWCSRVEASHFDAAAAYVSFDGHRTGDTHVYLYQTKDYGRTWKSLRANLPEFGWVHVVREDLRNRRLLYAGTEFGVFASLDEGESWFSLKNNLATVAVHDIAVHPRDNDLIIGTHGRGVWIMDDVAFLQEMTPAVFESAGQLFTVRPATRAFFSSIREGYARPPFAAKNPPAGLILTFYAKTAPKERPQLKIKDAKGRSMAEFKFATLPGFQRDQWGLTYIPEKDGVKTLPPAATMYGLPSAPPGEYTLSLTVDGRVMETKAVIEPDPRIAVSDETMAAQVAAISKASVQAARLAAAVTAVRSLRDQIAKTEEAVGKAGASAAAAAPVLAAFKAKVNSLAEDILPKDYIGLGSRIQTLRGGMPFQMIVSILASTANSPEPPTAGELLKISEIEKIAGEQIGRLNVLILNGIPPLNESLKKAGLTSALRAPAEIK
ncbi:MAG: VPS10 domain-containing protein [Candidatus Aminicenantales bacterium]